MRDTIAGANGSIKDWANYLFLHKPTAISYFHIKRIQQILIQNENIYQNAALKTIGYQPSYYSEKEKDAILFEPNNNTTQNIEQPELLDTFKKMPNPSPNPPAAMATPKYPVQADSTYDAASNTDNFDEFIQRIITSLHSETFYVGIPNEVLREFNYLMGVDFDFEITPKADIIYERNTYKIRFPKPGQYTLRFSDKKKFNKKMDKFIEVWMGKHEKFDLGKNRQVNVYQITKDELFAYLDLVLQFLTGDSMNNSVYKLSKYTLGSVMNSKKNVDLMSIRDDIVRNINRMKYRLRLQ
jgi:hypothetical protein